jgi:molybdopterin-guanine dinucleotide biosynthesis protein
LGRAPAVVLTGRAPFEDSMRPTIVAVGGFTSNTGKTTLACELLARLRGWEAIKVSRGHYRSCGRDPRACCISPLLGAEPVVRSGRAETYAPGKDTGRYWDAGASNVHWAIVTDRQVGEGVRAALGRVESEGVLIEGNSVLRHLEPDFFLMVARPDVLKIKPTARRALAKASALYVSCEGEGNDEGEMRRFAEWQASAGLSKAIDGLPVYTREDIPRLAALISSMRRTPGGRLEAGGVAAAL